MKYDLDSIFEKTSSALNVYIICETVIADGVGGVRTVSLSESAIRCYLFMARQHPFINYLID